MRQRYLEVTFRRGKALAAYLYLPRHPGARSFRTERRGYGLLVDHGADEQPIGIEITCPSGLRLVEINTLLEQLGQSPIGPEEIAPLAA